MKTRKCVFSVPIYSLVRDPEQLNSKKEISLCFTFVLCKATNRTKISALGRSFFSQPFCDGKITVEMNLEDTGLNKVKLYFELYHIKVIYIT